jgi:hypothetical protein
MSAYAIVYRSSPTIVFATEMIISIYEMIIS